MGNPKIIKECRKLTTGILRERCLKRDNFTCVKCGSRENIDVHHKVYRIPPRLNDLITMCKSCHLKFHGEKNRLVTAPICSKCNSTFTYIRFKDKERVCRSCGYVERLEEDKQ